MVQIDAGDLVFVGVGNADHAVAKLPGVRVRVLLDADVQPMRGDMPQRMYGLEPSQMRRMLCAAGVGLQAGQGVCVDVSPEADPDFRVVYAAGWLTHTDAHLKYIPEAERGTDE